VRWRFLRALLALFISVAAWAAPADEHLLAGARHFRAERYGEALVEFKVAEQLGAGASAHYYVAASLQKLGRAEESVESFAAATSAAPHERDALLDYYYALACYDVRLYGRADRLLSSVGERSGPRIAAMAGKVRADLAPLLAAPPSPANIDWYLERSAEALKAGRPRAAVAYIEEGLSLATRRGDRYRAQEAAARLKEAAKALESR